MFDLFRSRDKAVRFFLSALLLIVALSMVTYLIPSYGTGDRGTDGILAKIGKDTVTMREAQLAIQAQMRGRTVPPDLISLYIPRIVDEIITQRSLVYEATRLGLTVTDEETQNAIRGAIPQLFQDGKFVGKEAYEALLAQQNLSIPEFEAEMQRQVLINRLRIIAIEGTVVSPPEIEREYHRRYDKVKIQYVKISPDKLKSEAQVTPAEIKEYHDKNPNAFPVPEKKSMELVILDQAKLEQSINPSDADLHRLYDADRERFRTSERVQVRHMLLKTTGKSPEEDAKIKAKAEDLLKLLKAGGDFAELARKNSEDPGSATKGGDLGWVARGQTVKPFEDTAFSLKPKEISGLVKTEYGYHILQVLDHEQAHQRTFDEVKAQLADEFRKQRASQIMQDLPDRMEAALKKEPPAKVASEMNLAPPITVENVSAGDPIPDVGVNKDFEQSLAGLQKGAVSQPVALPPNRIVMAVVTKVTPTHPASLEEAQGRIRQMLESQKLQQLVTKRANELVAKAQAMNGDLEKAAKSLGLEVKSPDAFSRQGAVEGLGQAGFVGQAFDRPEGAIFGPLPLSDGQVVGKVMSHLPADMSQFEAQRIGLRDELKSKKARERVDLFDAGLREELIKEGKVKIYQDVVNRLVASYRG